MGSVPSGLERKEERFGGGGREWNKWEGGVLRLLSLLRRVELGISTGAQCY